MFVAVNGRSRTAFTLEKVNDIFQQRSNEIGILELSVNVLNEIYNNKALL